MIRYHPIENPAPWTDATAADLRSFNWHTGEAEFVFLEDQRQVLIVWFDGQCIVRMLDELPLSTEGDGDREGLVPHHFAYRVEGDPFYEAQSEFGGTLNDRQATIGF